MDYIKAFLIGGLLCLIGQVIIDKTKLTPARILVGYVVAGVFLSAIGLYDKIVDFVVGTIDFKTLSPSNHVFAFTNENVALSEESDTVEFTVNVDMSGIGQEYISSSVADIILNNPDNLDYKISSLNKAIVVIGAEKDLKSITNDDVKIEVDLSDVEISAGQTVTVPAVVSINNAGCWIYGSYSVEVSL